VSRTRPPDTGLSYGMRAIRYSKITLDLRKIGFWTGVLLLDIGFYYGLTRLVMWATSL
jgi:hypothetical protein